MSALSDRKIHGSRLYRSTIKCLVSGTAVDNSNSTGTQYTFSGGEVVELQNRGPSAAYVEVVASASYTAAGAKSISLEPNEKFILTLQAGATKISVDGVSGACDVLAYELQID